MTISRASRPVRRRAVATAVALSLLAPTTFGDAAQPTGSSLAAPVSRIVLGVGSDATEANVAWQSSHPGEQFLEYWPKDDPEKNVKKPSTPGQNIVGIFHPQEATMIDLKPNTTYVYRVGGDTHGWSEERTFTTGADAESWNFLAMSDAQIGVDAKVWEQAAAWNKAVEQATGDHPDSAFIMHLGDQIEGWGSPTLQLEKFTAPEKLHNYRLAVLKGNHETYAPESRFRDSYSLPNEDASTGDYFFTYNNVLFIGLDGNESSTIDIYQHEKFVNAAIDAHGAEADWVIVGIHQAPFSQGTHYSDLDVKRLREILAPKLSEAGVDLVLSGHDHIYTRTHLMEGSKPVIPEGAAKSGDVLTPKEGQVLYVTSTTATGGKYYDFQDEDGETYPKITEEEARPLAHTSTARWRQDYTPDYTSIDVSADELKITTTDIETQELIDEVTLKKGENEDTGNPETSGSSTAGKVVTALAIVAGLLASIVAVIAHVNPQWFQDLRNQFNI